MSRPNLFSRYIPLSQFIVFVIVIVILIALPQIFSSISINIFNFHSNKLTQLLGEPVSIADFVAHWYLVSCFNNLVAILVSIILLSLTKEAIAVIGILGSLLIVNVLSIFLLYYSANTMFISCINFLTYCLTGLLGTNDRRINSKDDTFYIIQLWSNDFPCLLVSTFFFVLPIIFRNRVVSNPDFLTGVSASILMLSNFIFGILQIKILPLLDNRQRTQHNSELRIY